MTRLALLPHLTDSELHELAAALVSRIDRIQDRIAEGVSTPHNVEALATCRSLLTAVREAMNNLSEQEDDLSGQRAILGRQVAAFVTILEAHGLDVSVTWRPHDDLGLEPDATIRIVVPSKD